MPRRYYGFAVDEVKLYMDGVENGSIPRLSDAASEKEETHYLSNCLGNDILTASRRVMLAQRHIIKGVTVKTIRIDKNYWSGSVWVLPKQYKPKNITEERRKQLQVWKQAMNIPVDESPSYFSWCSPEARTLYPKSANKYVWGLRKFAAKPEATVESSE
ncbi:hypothetical protein FA95DRAFT_1566203 [Auriscalpium vulgare]|uniref:Uncharacterized protein n=1 Tax=Auriscalpium vulgare TaxID=40419 RepID=A0ACB8R9S2_9AGAM|nr:hypothetical protein FA95DRAFT_1566203 [Auriscalpium vulgare]